MRGGPEALASSDVEGGGNATPNLKVWSDYQYPTLGGHKRQQCHEASLTAAHRNLEDGVICAVPKMLVRAEPSLYLGIAQVRIALNVWFSVIE
jgi:hypothetical protein